MDNHPPPLPSFSELSESDRAEASRLAEAAHRAEERAELRQAERERARAHALLERRLAGGGGNKAVRRDDKKEKTVPAGESEGGGRLQFVSKKRRLELQEERENATRREQQQEQEKLQRELQRQQKQKMKPPARGSSSSSRRGSTHGSSASTSKLPTKSELAAAKRKRLAKRITFKFEWDEDEDTTKNADAGLPSLYDDRMRNGGGAPHRKRKAANLPPRSANHMDKPLASMTARDWRILREDHDIRVRGRAPPPLRRFDERGAPVRIHPALLDAVREVLRYKDPSPIQRQAIPIGMERRDMIGVAETGSGKTAAFGIPLLHHVMRLSPEVLAAVSETGPLALIMAPTRELALQIEEVVKQLLTRQPRNAPTQIKSLAVVGGQSVTLQATALREGIHVVVGTPGRLNDCIETRYLVLETCTYVVLDEADRMIDMGFAPQIASILEAMGGKMKSTVEEEAYRQEKADCTEKDSVGGVPEYRLTAMFSATMPPEVEMIAKTYLRHPAIVSVGDRDSGRNKRIVQRVMFLNGPSHKERALRDILSRSRPDEKIIVFVNEKKNADSTGRMVERSGRRVVVLHGGKAQDQREESLGAFRRGGVVLVATDVAGRGLDVPDVSHVINFDVPGRSIDSYCHRIGRTGRAGQEGLATSFVTDEDTGIMAALKLYLESTGAPVPERLARHPSAAGAGGVIDKRDLYLS